MFEIKAKHRVNSRKLNGPSEKRAERQDRREGLRDEDKKSDEKLNIKL